MKRPPGLWLLLSAGVLFLTFEDVYAVRATSLIFGRTTTTSTTTEVPATDVSENAEDEVGSTEAIETNSTTPKLTGIPQIDYIYDQNLPRELNGYNLTEYPFYERVPEEIDFKCDGLHDGFYASIPHKCQVYHHCLFGTRYDFLCANYTAFDQKTFICHFVSEVDCVNSKKFWHRNDALYQAASTTTVKPQFIYTPPQQPSILRPSAAGNSGGGDVAQAIAGSQPVAAPPPLPILAEGRRRRPPYRRRRPQYDYYDEYDEDDYDEPRRDRGRKRPRPRPRPIYDDEYDDYEDRYYRRGGSRRDDDGKRPYDRRRNKDRRPYDDEEEDDKRTKGRRTDDDELKSKDRRKDDRYDNRRKKDEDEDIEDDDRRKDYRRKNNRNEDRRKDDEDDVIDDEEVERKRKKNDRHKGEERSFPDSKKSNKRRPHDDEDDYDRPYDRRKGNRRPYDEEEEEEDRPRSRNDDRRRNEDDRKRFGEGRRNNDSYRKRNNDKDDDKSKEDEKPQESIAVVKPSSGSSVFDRPRAPPRIKPPVPKSEAGKYSFKTSTVKPTPKPVDDEEYYDEYEDEVTTPKPKPKPEPERRPSKYAMSPRSRGQPPRKEEEPESEEITEKPRKASIYESRDRRVGVGGKKRPVVEDYYDEDEVTTKDSKRSYSSRERNSKENKDKDDGSVEKIEQGSKKSEEPTTTVAPTTVTTNQKERHEPIVRVVKRPFLPSRGGNPYSSRNLQPVGLKAENTSSKNQQETNTRNNKDTEEPKETNKNLSKDASKESEEVEEQPRKIFPDPPTRNSGKSVEEILDGKDDPEEKPFKPSPIVIKVPIRKYAPIDETATNRAPFLGQQRKAIKEFNTATTVKPKTPERNPLDINENEYDVTLNDALNPTLPNLPVRGYPAGFSPSSDYTYSTFTRPRFNPDPVLNTASSELAYRVKQPVRYEPVQKSPEYSPYNARHTGRVTQANFFY